MSCCISLLLDAVRMRDTFRCQDGKERSAVVDVILYNDDISF